MPRHGVRGVVSSGLLLTSSVYMGVSMETTSVNLLLPRGTCMEIMQLGGIPFVHLFFIPYILIAVQVYRYRSDRGDSLFSSYRFSVNIRNCFPSDLMRDTKAGLMEWFLSSRDKVELRMQVGYDVSTFQYLFMVHFHSLYGFILGKDIGSLSPVQHRTAVGAYDMD